MREITTGRVRSCSTKHIQHPVTQCLLYAPPHQRTSALTGRTLPASGHSSRQRPVTRPRCVLTAATDRTLNPASGHYTTSVQSLCAPLSFLSRAPVAPLDCPYSTDGHFVGGVSYPCTQTSQPLIKCANHQVYHLVHMC